MFWIREKDEEAALKAGLKLVFEEGWVEEEAAELAVCSPLYFHVCHLSLADSLLTS